MSEPVLNVHNPKTLIQTSAPGSLMLMGEHAVLHGELCLAGAVDLRVNVTLQPLSEPRLQIQSTLAEYDEPLQTLPDHSSLRFVIAAVRAEQARLPTGLCLSIESDFSHTVGLGSSSAVTVAVVAALQQWLDGEIAQAQVFDQARQVMLSVQGRGSGFDIAAATYGGVVAYRSNPLFMEPVFTDTEAVLPEIGLFYSGYKTPTVEVIKLIEARSVDAKEQDQNLYQQMGFLSAAALTALKAQDLPEFGRLMNAYQSLLEQLGVCDDTLTDMLAKLHEAGVPGAKISGSGLGDCVISLGNAESLDIGYQKIPVRLTQLGVTATTLEG